MPHGKIDVVWLDDRVVGRLIYQPGWRWSIDVKPTAETSSCQFHHFGITLSGRLRIQMQDGIELEIGEGDVFEIPPGHDAWVVGDEPWVSIDFEAMRGFALAPSDAGKRSLATVMITDIVGSTERAVELGPARWRELLGRHNELSETAIGRAGGRLVKTTGDGVLAIFGSAEGALRAAIAIQAQVQEMGLSLRIGMHTGDVELSAGDARGLTVHTAARIAASADAGSIVLSSTMREIIDAKDLDFEEFGVHELKGIPGPRRLYRLVPRVVRRPIPAAAH